MSHSALGKISKWAAHPRRPPSKSGRPVPGTFMEISRNFRKKRALLLGTSARSARMVRRREWRNDETARNRRRDAKNGRSMPLGTLQDTGKALSRPFDHRVTHGGHGKTAKAAEEALRAQDGLSAEAPLRPNPLSMHLGHAPRRGTVCPHTLASTVTHGARRQGPNGGPTSDG